MYSRIVSFLKRPILKEISWYAVGQAGTQVFAFLGVLITARYLGPINLGLYSFVQNYLGAFMTIIGSMELYFTWKIARGEDKFECLKESIGYKLYVTVFISLLGTALAWVVLPKDVALLATVIFSPLILGSTSGFYSYAVASKKANLVAILHILASALIFTVKVVLVYIKAPLMAFVATNAFEGVLMIVAITLYFFTQQDIRNSFRSFRMPSLYQTAKFLFSVKTNIALLVLWQLIIRIDQLVVATFSNAYSLGLYAAAVRIAEVPNVFSGILYTAMISRVVFFDKENKQGFKKIFFVYLLAGSLFTLFIVIAAPWLVILLYGDKFMEAVPILRAYALSIPGAFILTHSFSIYGVRGDQTKQVIIFGTGVVINVALIYLLSPVFGLVGAALATSFAYTLIAYMFYLDSK